MVLEAVKQSGVALNYAGYRLRDDKEVVLEAVKKNGMALRYASEELVNNKQVVLVAVNKNVAALTYVSENLKNNKDFLYEIKDSIEKEKERFSIEYELFKKFEREDYLINSIVDNSEKSLNNQIKLKI